MAEAIYVLCAVTSVVCAVLLQRQYAKTGTTLLAWSAACFAGLAANNLIVLIDLVVAPQVDLSLVRSGVALLAVSSLVVGLISESR